MLNSMNQVISSVYGPVDSWRMGKSLGIDLIMDPSTCSFNCTYCQLGFIQKITMERKIYVETKQVLEDLKKSNWKEADIITFSGSGEPTLATNIEEVIREIKNYTSKPVSILTNATLLYMENVRKEIANADMISAKLDAPSDEVLKMINRPAQEVTLEKIVEGIKLLKKDIKDQNRKTKLQIQMMFMPQNKNKVKELAALLKDIGPDEIALNTPTRPYPSGWDIFSRGAHGEDSKKIKYETKELKKLTMDEATSIEKELKDLTGLNFISVYKPHA